MSGCRLRGLWCLKHRDYAKPSDDQCRYALLAAEVETLRAQVKAVRDAAAKWEYRPPTSLLDEIKTALGGAQ